VRDTTTEVGDVITERKTLNNIFLWIIPAFLGAALIVLASLPEGTAVTTASRLFAGLFVLMAMYDIATLRVPNVVVYSAIVFALGAVLVIESSLFLDALEGAGALLLIMYVIAVLGKGAMGMADVKVGVFAGAVLGSQYGVMAMLFGFAAAGVLAAVVLVLHLRQRKDVAPLTPFLSTSGIVFLILFGSVLSR
jgi:prepilin signal peptidase PulO-like enzyme (type II secretory pathway)